jgi:hypothetical protein
VQDALPIVIVVVAVVAAVVAVATLLSSGSQYDRIGRGDLTFDRDAGPASDPYREDEIRQLLEARNARRAAAGKPTVDVEAELAALSRPAADEELRAEIRSLVEARNARLLARGRPPLDVEAEIARRLSDLDG